MAQFLVGQIISFQPSSSGGWGIIVAQGNDDRRFFAHGKAFLDGSPEVGSLVSFLPTPADGQKLPRAKQITVIATPDAEGEPRHKTIKKPR
jgi:hypothetical protein